MFPQDLGLPSQLNAANEARQLAIAYYCEAHNALISDAVTAERRYRQMVVATRNYELRMHSAHIKAQRLKEKVDLLVNTALDELAALAGNRSPDIDGTESSSQLEQSACTSTSRS